MPLTEVSPCKHHEAGMQVLDTYPLPGHGHGQSMTVAWAVGTHLARHVSCPTHIYIHSSFSNWHASAMVQPCTSIYTGILNAFQGFDMISVLLSYYFQLLSMLMFSDSKATFLQLTEEGHGVSNKLHLLMLDWNQFFFDVITQSSQFLQMYILS